jgi:hypothetical protein
VSTPDPLLVPLPALAFKALAGTFATLEDAVSISFGAVLFLDGSSVIAEESTGAQALLIRTASPVATPEVWDPVTKTWVVEGFADLSQLKGVPLLPPETGPGPWKGVLIGAGQTDAAGAPLLEPAIAHFPQYRLRGSFRARRGAVEAFGLGPESAALEFASALAIVPPFGAELTPDPATATRVRLVLRNAAAQAVGALEIDASAGNAMITLQNFDASGAPLASITLQPDGAIRLAPLTNMRVVIAGDLQTGRINYLSGGAPRDLP